MISSTKLRKLKFLYEITLNNLLIVISALFTSYILFKVTHLKPAELLSLLHAIRLVHLFWGAFLPTATITYYLLQRPRAVYLIDYACFRAESELHVPIASFIEHMHFFPFLDEKSRHFLTKVVQRSGLGDETNLPLGLHYLPPQCGFTEGLAEVELVIFSVIDDLLAKTCINPNAIDVVIVNCSLFAPIPTLVDMIINRYKLREDIRSMNLSGMGCSAGLISIELTRSLLQTMPHGAHALVVSTETLSHLFYEGRKRAMLLPSILFRMGGAAMLISSSMAKARFRLTHILRTFTGTQDYAYRCVILEEDEEGNLGINLSRDIIAIASTALKVCITSIAPLVLPTSELLLFILSSIKSMVLNRRSNKLYVPNFCMAFEHFCIHAGGPAVIDAVQNSLNLSNEHAEPSRMTLHRFGNTSSSSLWYELAYIEAKGRMQKGDRVWMIGFGSGYKCNTAVWKCIQPSGKADRSWAECIHRYPVETCHQ